MSWREEVKRGRLWLPVCVKGLITVSGLIDSVNTVTMLVNDMVSSDVI